MNAIFDEAMVYCLWQLQNLSEWMADEWAAVQVNLYWLVKDLWWAVLLAAGMDYFEGGTGGIREIVKTSLAIRLMVLPSNMWRWLLTDVERWMMTVQTRLFLCEGLLEDIHRGRRPVVHP